MFFYDFSASNSESSSRNLIDIVRMKSNNLYVKVDVVIIVIWGTRGMTPNVLISKD